MFKRSNTDSIAMHCGFKLFVLFSIRFYNSRGTSTHLSWCFFKHWETQRPAMDGKSL